MSVREYLFSTHFYWLTFLAHNSSKNYTTYMYSIINFSIKFSICHNLNYYFYILLAYEMQKVWELWIFFSVFHLYFWICFKWICYSSNIGVFAFVWLSYKGLVVVWYSQMYYSMPWLIWWSLANLNKVLLTSVWLYFLKYFFCLFSPIQEYKMFWKKNR